jgi:hypothetical protein
MPTYRNTTQNTVYARDYVFNPGQTKETQYYLNLTEYPELVKTLDTPEISRPFELVLTNVTAATIDLTDPRTFLHSVVIRVNDTTAACTNGDTVDVQLFGGYDDDQDNWLPLGLPIRFTRFTHNDSDGVLTPFWRPTGLATHHPSQVVQNVQRNICTFYSIGIIAASITPPGSLEIHVKDVN